MGMVGAVWITRPEWKTTENKRIMFFLVIVTYILFICANGIILYNQKSYQIFKMTWTNKGAKNEFKESEIVLRFMDSPDQSEGIYSNDLSNYLHQLNKRYVDVTFEITSDYGCFRGYHETQIEKLTSWKTVWGYSSSKAVRYSSVNDNSVFGPDPWWCP